MEHTNETPDQVGMPATVTEWAAALRRELAGPLAPAAAARYCAAAADIADAGSTASGAASPWARVARRTRMVASTVFSTWIAKIIGGVVAVAAATGGAVAAGVDLHDILPFLGGGQPTIETVAPAGGPEASLTTMPGGPTPTTPGGSPADPSDPGEPPAAATTSTTTTVGPSAGSGVPGMPGQPTTTTTTPLVRPPLSPPVGPQG